MEPVPCNKEDGRKQNGSINSARAKKVNLLPDLNQKRTSNVPVNLPRTPIKSQRVRQSNIIAANAEAGMMQLNVPGANNPPKEFSKYAQVEQIPSSRNLGLRKDYQSNHNI